MSNKIWDDKSTDLTLNGPTISVSSDTSANISLVAPNGQTGGGVTDQTSVTFSVTGVSTFPDGTNADGGLSYQWYEINEGALGISTRYAGAGTSSLTISYALSPEDDGNQYYNRISFNPDNVSAGGTSGGSINGFVDTTPVSISVAPELFVSAGITTATVPINVDATFNCLGGINRDGTPVRESDISYQWYLDGSTLSDGVTQSTQSATTVVQTYGVGNHTLTIPDDATNVSIRIRGAAGGSGGSDVGGSGGSAGQGRVGKFSIADGGRTLTINVGSRGSNGARAQNGGSGSGGDTSVSGGDGGRGGNTGTNDASGGGGGGGAGVFIFDSISDGYILAAGAGGGGGGGSDGAAGTSGSNGGDWQSVSGSLSGFGNGGSGADKGSGEGGGGGGAGAGYRGGSGGTAGIDEPPPPPPPSGGGGGGIPCFTSDARVLMWPATPNCGDLIERPISEIKVGDYVINKDRTSNNKVTFIEKHDPNSKDPDLYSPRENIPPFATINHPLFVDGEWVAVDVDLYPWLEKQRPLRNANIEETGDRKLYNIWLSGDGTYNVNGFGTHSIMFDGGFMKNCFAQKLLTYDEVMSLMRSYTYDKTNLVKGAFLLNKLFGKINLKLLNRLWIYCLNGDDMSKRKRIIHKMMKLLQGGV